MPVGVWRRRHYLPGSVVVGVTAIEVKAGSISIAWTLDPTTTWTPVTTDPYGANGAFGVRWLNNQWIAGGGGTAGAKSSDGQTWSTFHIPPLEGYSGCAVYDYEWTGSLWVACGFGGFSPPSPGNIIATSPDLVTWTGQATAPGSTARKLANSGSLLVCVGGFGVLTSPDGITWTSRTSGFGGEGRSVVWGGGQFVAGIGPSGGAVIFTSPDGITWTARTSPFDGGVVFGVGYHGGLFVAVGANGASTGAVVITSADGVTWTAQSTPLDGPFDGSSFASLEAVAYDTVQSVWIASGTSGSAAGSVTSPDGVTWTFVADYTTFNTQAIAAR